MSTSDYIQFFALLITIGTLIYTQRQQYNETSKLEKRTANKLKILFLCQDTARTEKEIIELFNRMNLEQKADEVEIQKTLYEMLRDETLRYRSNQTYKARTNKAQSASRKTKSD